jgi:hypothetical protein
MAPVPKKGIKSKIENYRPIANLCSTTKIFERLQRILQIEKDNNVDIIGLQHYDLKKGQSTNMASLALQTIYNYSPDLRYRMSTQNILINFFYFTMFFKV